MRIKLLAFPVMLALSIAIFIAYVWPEQGALREAMRGFEKSKADLQNIVEKKNNIEKLKSSLIQNQSKADFARKFLPAGKNEEEIINGLNYLAANSGVSLASLSLEKDQTNIGTGGAGATGATSSKDVLFSASPGAGADLAGGPPEVQLSGVKAKAGVAGSYEGVKSFLEQVYKMEMFNSITSLSIARQEASSQPAQGNNPPAGANSGMLLATLEINFGYLREVKISKDYSSPIFSRSSFDLAAYDKLVNLISRKIPVLEVGEEGRANPFLP